MDAAAPSSILLYRYLDAAAALKSIESRSLRVSRLQELNDPFEWRLGITGIIPQGEPLVEKWMASILAAQNKVFGLMCFSATCEEPVLWSHYADKHRGVAFEVDYDLKLPDHLIEMSYPPTRLVVDAQQYTQLQKNEPELREYLLPFMQQLLRQKSPSWAYEREYCIYFNLAKDQLQTAGGHYFAPIPDNFLTRVILGWRCPLEEQYVAKALEKSGLTSTKVVRAKISNDTYAVRC